MKKHKYLFVACLSLFPIMVVAENDTRNYCCPLKLFEPKN